MMRRFKNEGFFLVQEAEKLEMQKATKKVQKKKKEIKNNLYPEGRKNGTRKDLCSKKKNEEIKLKKGKRKREMQNQSYLKKSKAKTNQRRETRREKNKGRKEVCKKRKKGSCSKRKRKNILFLKIKCNKKE